MQETGHIYVALGANLTSHVGPPQVTLESIPGRLELRRVAVLRQSRWYRSPAFPDPSEPEFVNGVLEIDTDLAPDALLAVLHEIERELGRRRIKRWEPRVADLDLLDYRGLHQSQPAAGGPELPHPRMQDRDFVLLPLRDVAPDWRHPLSGLTIDDLIEALPGPVVARPMD